MKAGQKQERRTRHCNQKKMRSRFKRIRSFSSRRKASLGCPAPLSATPPSDYSIAFVGLSTYKLPVPAGSHQPLGIQGDEDFACRQGLLVLVRTVTYRCFQLSCRKCFRRLTGLWTGPKAIGLAHKCRERVCEEIPELQLLSYLPLTSVNLRDLRHLKTISGSLVHDLHFYFLLCLLLIVPNTSQAPTFNLKNGIFRQRQSLRRRCRWPQ